MSTRRKRKQGNFTTCRGCGQRLPKKLREKARKVSEAGIWGRNSDEAGRTEVCHKECCYRCKNGYECKLHEVENDDKKA